MYTKIARGLKITFIVALSTVTAYAQQSMQPEIPEYVTNAFSALYPRIKEVSWDYSEPSYEASFKLDGKSISLIFDETGFVNQVKYEIRQFELPLDISQLITREYSGWSIGKALHIDSFGTAYYEAIVEREKQTVVLVFNGNGRLMIRMIQ